MASERAELEQVDSAFVQTLIDSRFSGYAKIKLCKLKPAVLDELVRRCAKEVKSDATTDEKVASLLVAKKALRKQMAAPAAARSPTPTKAPSPTPTKAPSPLAAPPAQNGVFQRGHGISIVGFNSLKLRLDHPDLKGEWKAAVLEFAKHDVLMLSEVRAGDKHFKPRVLRLIEMLHDCTNDEWSWRMSEVSNGEVHLLVVKRPIDIVEVQTIHDIEGVSMEYAPLVAHIDDPRFTGELHRFCLVSVHAPPNSGTARRSQRDAQLTKLVASYSFQAGLRLGLPFSNQAAKETRQKRPYTAHIVAGDFNASATELRDLGAERCGWEMVFGNLRTSSGGKAYDNFLINRDTKDHLMLSSHIYDLTRFANFAKGEQGISDHAPIVLSLHEQPPRP